MKFAGQRPIEREPMWDGNLGSWRETADTLVEREPMWDGNYRLGVPFGGRAELSENQCGMETCVLPDEIISKLR